VTDRKPSERLDNTSPPDDFINILDSHHAAIEELRARIRNVRTCSRCCQDIARIDAQFASPAEPRTDDAVEMLRKLTCYDSQSLITVGRIIAAVETMRDDAARNELLLNQLAEQRSDWMQKAIVAAEALAAEKRAHESAKAELIAAREYSGGEISRLNAELAASQSARNRLSAELESTARGERIWKQRAIEGGAQSSDGLREAVEKLVARYERGVESGHGVMVAMRSLLASHPAPSVSQAGEGCGVDYWHDRAIEAERESATLRARIDTAAGMLREIYNSELPKTFGVALAEISLVLSVLTATGADTATIPGVEK
jgi:hypothetical protein